MTTLEEKFFEAVIEVSDAYTGNVPKIKIAEKCTELAKEFAKNFDVWKEKNRWQISLIDVDEYVYHKLGETFKTYDQLIELYEEHLKSK